MSAPGPVRAAEDSRSNWETPDELLACTKCKNPLPPTLEFFGPKPAKANKLDSWCRSCVRERARLNQQKRRLETPELVREEKRRHAQSPVGRETKRVYSAVDNHKRRQSSGLPFIWSRKLWDRCRADWLYLCAYCGAKPESLWQDHFVTLSDPQCPGTVPWNMVPACAFCNLSKSRSRPERWLRNTVRLFAITNYLERQAAIFRPQPEGLSVGPTVRLWEWKA